MVVHVLYEKVCSRGIKAMFVVKVKVVALYRRRRNTDNLLSGDYPDLQDVRHRRYHCRNRQRDYYLCQTVDHVTIGMFKWTFAWAVEISTRFWNTCQQSDLHGGLPQFTRPSIPAYWSSPKNAPWPKLAYLTTSFTKLQAAARWGEEPDMYTSSSHRLNNRKKTSSPRDD